MLCAAYHQRALNYTPSGTNLPCRSATGIMVLRVVVESRESLRIHGAGHATGLAILPALTSRPRCRRVHCCRLPLLVDGGKVYRSTQPPWCSLLISRHGAWHGQRLARCSSSCRKLSRATSPFSSNAPRPVQHRAAQCQGGRYWRDRVLTRTRREATSFCSTDDVRTEAPATFCLEKGRVWI